MGIPHSADHRDRLNYLVNKAKQDNIEPGEEAQMIQLILVTHRKDLIRTLHDLFKEKFEQLKDPTLRELINQRGVLSRFLNITGFFVKHKGNLIGFKREKDQWTMVDLERSSHALIEPGTMYISNPQYITSECDKLFLEAALDQEISPKLRSLIREKGNQTKIYGEFPGIEVKTEPPEGTHYLSTIHNFAKVRFTNLNTLYWLYWMRYETRTGDPHKTPVYHLSRPSDMHFLDHQLKRLQEPFIQT